MLKHLIDFALCRFGLITVQDNTMLKPITGATSHSFCLITVQDNTMLKLVIVLTC